MRAFRGCSALVIRCFKKVEAFADWLTGAAGPFFVFFCWTLIVLGGVAFFDTIGRDLSWITSILLSPVLVLVPLNLYGQYYLASNVPPGYPSPRAMQKSPHKPMSTEKEIKWLTHDPKSPKWPEYWGWRRPSGVETRTLTGSAMNDPPTNASGERRRVRRCRKCDGPKPERAHHCSVCKRCVLLMDHHCPWINGCVGIHNQRHFILFMAWLGLACWIVFAFGWERAWRSIDYRSDWSGYTPRIAFTLLYVLSIAIGVAVPVLGGWHVYLASRGETSIESHDNHYLEGKAKAEGLIYLNPYDLGRKRNLQLFFNIGPGGYPMLTLLFPILVPPYTNGWTFPRRPLPADHDHHLKGVKLHEPELSYGLISSENGRAPPFGEGDGPGGKYVMGDQEGLTDDEEGGGGWMDYDY